MKYFVGFLLILLNFEFIFAGSDTVVSFNIVPINVVQHSQAQNLVEIFNDKLNETLNTVKEKLDGVLGNKTMTPKEVILIVENIRDESENHIDNLLNQLLIDLSKITQVSLDTFKEAISSNQTLPEDVSKIVEFGRVSIYKTDAIREAIFGRAYEFLFIYLGQIKS